MRRLRLLLAVLCALALPGCGGSSEAGQASGSAPSASGDARSVTPGESTSPSQEAARINLADLGANAGDADAPIRVVEFSDFGCPHCQAFHQETYPLLHEEYVETGKVIWKYVPYVLGAFPNSLEAARAGECAMEQGAFPRVRDLIFDHQQEWMTAPSPVDRFAEYAADADLDVERFRSCIDEGRREDRIRATIDSGRRLRIQGTPTFFIQGTSYQGNRPADFYREIFDRILEGGEPPGPETGARL